MRNPSHSVLHASSAGIPSTSPAHLFQVPQLPETSPSPSPIAFSSGFNTSSIFSSHTGTLRSKLRLRKHSTSSQHSNNNGCPTELHCGSSDFYLTEDQLTMPPPPLPNGTMVANLTVGSPSRQLDHARHFVRQLANALRYLQDIVEKDTLEQLSGAASILLEIVVTGYAKLKAHLITDQNRYSSFRFFSSLQMIDFIIIELIMRVL